MCRLYAYVVAKLKLYSANGELDPVRDFLQQAALTPPRDEIGKQKGNEVSTCQKKASQSPIETARRVKQLPTSEAGTLQLSEAVQLGIGQAKLPKA